MSLKLTAVYWILYIIYYCIVYIIIKIHNQSFDSKYTVFLIHILIFTILCIVNNPYVTGILILLMCIFNMVKEFFIVICSSVNNCNINECVMVIETATLIIGYGMLFTAVISNGI